MELKFSITSDQLKTLAKRVNSARVAKNAILAVRLHTFIIRILFLWLPLLLPAILYCSFWEEKTSEAYIAITICAILYFFAWNTLIKTQVESRVSKFPGETNALDYSIDTLTARGLAAIEGDYKAIFTPKILQLAMPNGKCITIKLRRIYCFKEDSDFYYLTIRKYVFVKATYLISKNGDITDTKIQAVLEEIFSSLNAFANFTDKSSEA